MKFTYQLLGFFLFMRSFQSDNKLPRPRLLRCPRAFTSSPERGGQTPGLPDHHQLVHHVPQPPEQVPHQGRPDRNLNNLIQIEFFFIYQNEKKNHQCFHSFASDVPVLIQTKPKKSEPYRGIKFLSFPNKNV